MALLDKRASLAGWGDNRVTSVFGTTDPVRGGGCSLALRHHPIRSVLPALMGASFDRKGWAQKERE